MENPRIIVVTGGVMSGIGKGHVTASIGKMLQFRGFHVTPIKIDPYLNTDPGLMNPGEHGEIFVTEDVWQFQTINNGEILHIAELDQDFGSYERFLNQNMHPSQNISSGQVFTTILKKERKGEYLGRTVQMIPQVTDEIKTRIMNFAQIDGIKLPHIILIEIGGTVGDIEANLFLEAVRQLQLDLGRNNVLFVHITLIPFNEPVNEFKTKPSQHSTQQLLSRGIFPDFIVCRSDINLEKHWETIRSKIALFCNVLTTHVIENPNFDEHRLYSLPLYFEKQSFGQFIVERLNLPLLLSKDEMAMKMTKWRLLIKNFDPNDQKKIKIGIAGKYPHNDAYKSIKEALLHACGSQKLSLEIIWINTDSELDFTELIKKIDGLLVPGGFGRRGTDNKIKIAQIAMKNKIPFLGICFGMQLATVGFARLIEGLENANSLEIDDQTSVPIVTLQEEQKRRVGLGGTMRLGSWSANLKKDSYIAKIYGQLTICERHRHRWEINNDYIPLLEENGLIFSGFSNENLAEYIELSEDQHPFFIGTQAHPEYKSRPENPHVIYKEFIRKSFMNKN